MAQAVIQYLVPPHPNEPLVAHVRLRDKYSLSPPTTFVGKDFLALIENRKDMIEYKQTNLTNPGMSDVLLTKRRTSSLCSRCRRMLQ